MGKIITTSTIILLAVFLASGCIDSSSKENSVNETISMITPTASVPNTANTESSHQNLSNRTVDNRNLKIISETKIVDNKPKTIITQLPALTLVEQNSTDLLLMVNLNSAYVYAMQIELSPASSISEEITFGQEADAASFTEKNEKNNKITIFAFAKEAAFKKEEFILAKIISEPETRITITPIEFSNNQGQILKENK